MKIDQTKVVQVEAKEIRIYCKVCDEFTAHIYSQDGEELGGQEAGYVPSFMPGEHFGDYLILDIDLDTGQVTNWSPPTKEQIMKFIKGNNED